MYNITETWVAGSAASYLAQCQPGFCGLSTTLACDPTTGMLSGSYPVCTPMGLPAGQQPFPIRATAAGVTQINVTCAAGFMPNPAVTASSWALGTCTLSSGSTTVAMPPTSTFACIPTGAAVVPIMSPVDPRWWPTSNAFWTTSFYGASVIQMNNLGGFDSGLAMFGGYQINLNPGFSVQFDGNFRLAPSILPADGITIIFHNDPRGPYAPTCPIFRGGCNGFNCNRACANSVTNSMYLYAPKTWNNNQASNYLTTGGAPSTVILLVLPR